MSDLTSKEKVSEERLRNTRAWASARPDMSGSGVIVAAIDELLQMREDWQTICDAAEAMPAETCANCERLQRDLDTAMLGLASEWLVRERVAHEPGAWQSMTTAPKDGREVLLRVKWRAGIPGKQLVGHYMGGGHCIEDHPPIAAGWYFWNGLMFDKAAEPTDWMPLPPDSAPTKPAEVG